MDVDMIGLPCFDETGDDIAQSEQEETEDNNEQGATLGNAQEEDLGVGGNIDTLTETVGKLSVGGRALTTNKTFQWIGPFPTCSTTMKQRLK